MASIVQCATRLPKEHDINYLPMPIKLDDIDVVVDFFHDEDIVDLFDVFLKSNTHAEKISSIDALKSTLADGINFVLRVPTVSNNIYSRNTSSAYGLLGSITIMKSKLPRSYYYNIVSRGILISADLLHHGQRLHSAMRLAEQLALDLCFGYRAITFLVDSNNEHMMASMESVGYKLTAKLPLDNAKCMKKIHRELSWLSKYLPVNYHKDVSIF